VLGYINKSESATKEISIAASTILQLYSPICLLGAHSNHFTFSQKLLCNEIYRTLLNLQFIWRHSKYRRSVSLACH